MISLDRYYVPCFNKPKEVKYERNQHPHRGGNSGQRTYQDGFCRKSKGLTAAYFPSCKDGTPSDRTIVDICREFGVSEHWLRTGEGEMFVRLSREEEITKFAMSIVRNPDSEFQRQLLATMAKLEPAQWQLMEQMLDDLIAQRTKKKEPSKVPSFLCVDSQ